MRHELQREVTDEDDIQRAIAWAREMTRRGLARGPVLWSLGRPRRTKDQNDKLWPMLTDVSKQVKWPDFDTGELVYLTKDEWKDLFTALVKRQRMLPGIEGGVVMIGAHTSRMTKRTFSELIEAIYAFGAERDVVWSDPKEAERLHSSAMEYLRKKREKEKAA